MRRGGFVCDLQGVGGRVVWPGEWVGVARGSHQRRAPVSWGQLYLETGHHHYTVLTSDSALTVPHMAYRELGRGLREML